jgi:diaminohydroxyphosphoribosylaminopyrimidine deaminase/5-amino-6-(5-phosphoribosylamino)uracil reductase
MTRAQSQALRGVALAHPNPIVGAVLVKDNLVIGEGFHVYDNRAHAEIIALKKAGKKARGATLYVTLEPCCTRGHTGPCTKAIIAGGVRRVVAAMQDPNPAVAGRGLAELRRAGIQVTVGVREQVSRWYNEDFACWIRTRLPFVTLKTALTLDGQISTRSGSTTWITGPYSRQQVQRLRHQSDAILTGIGTVLADDPRKSKLVKSAQDDLVIFTLQSLDSPKANALVGAGAEVVRLPAIRGRVDLRAALRELGQRQILNLLIEAGAELNGAALRAGIVDKMILFYAPKIMGTGGVPLARIPSSWFPKSPVLKNLRVYPWASDFAVEGYFHDVYRHHRTRRKN